MVRFFGTGLLLGALLVAFVAGAVGALPQALLPAPVRHTLFALVAVPVLVRELGLVRFPVPENARLVPQDVQHLRRWGALQFGFEMGTGMRTYSPSALPHLVLAAVLLVVPLPAAFAPAVGFALGRLAMPVLSNAWSDDGSWTAAWARAERVVRPVLALTCVGSLAVAILVP
ncbi:MAG TPA: hypothetical protein VKZ81_33470 [Pseudonocardia sp.]|uniref:hypothetical protein n=1 Tax=Pseudonocardia sp. TaxID=60912 RepID=UPI002B4B309A|nr:hypothetical protein [Pseudonocardia sp.]HLU60395.1 hypothetical protein [Pseudonocardia sp.]